MPRRVTLLGGFSAAVDGTTVPDTAWRLKYVKDGTIEAFELWNPADLGYLAAYAAVNAASGNLTGKTGQKFTAGKLGAYKVGAKATVLLGPPFVFNKANIDKFHF